MEPERPPPPAADTVFADRLILRARAFGHPLCVGLDPHLERVPPCYRRGSMKLGDPATATAVADFLKAVIDGVAERAVAVKPQIAFFEQLGWRGLRALAAVVAHARAAGLPVILDAKRGDIGSTAAAYARAYLAPDAPLAVDAMTVNPYLGRDSLEPLVAAARVAGGGLFVLVKTSNPGAGDYQDRRVGKRRLYQQVAASLAPLASSLRGETGFSSLGVVVGATYPEESERVRALLPDALFLVPGYGAQGASAADAVRGFVRGPGGRLEGGVVNSSRGILFPAGADTGDPRRYARALEDALDRAADELGAAVSPSP